MPVAALVIEDGTMVAEANSYATIAQLVQYAANRGVTLPEDADDQTVLMFAAMDYIEAQEFKFQGCRTGSAYYPTTVQALSWPRVGIWFYGGRWPSNVIPPNLLMAQCQLACDAASGVTLLPTTASTGNLQKKIRGPITDQYFAPNMAMNTSPTLLAANGLLKPLYKAVSLQVGRG